MRGVVFLGNRELEITTFPDPTPGPITDHWQLDQAAEAYLAFDLQSGGKGVFVF